MPADESKKVDLVDLIQGKRREIVRGKKHYCVVSGKHVCLDDAQKAFIAAYEEKGPYEDGGIHWRMKPVIANSSKMYSIVARFSIG